MSLRRAFFTSLVSSRVTTPPPTDAPIGANLLMGNPGITASDSLRLAGSRSFSIECHLYPIPAPLTGPPRYQTIGRQAGPNADIISFYFSEYSTQLTAAIVTNLGYYQTITVPIDPTLYRHRWVHLALVWDGTELFLYRTFEGEATTILATALASGGTMTEGTAEHYNILGAYFQGNFSTYLGYAGEYRIWRSARSAAEIADNAFRRLPTPASQPELLHYWPMTGAINDTASPDLGSVPTPALYVDAFIDSLPDDRSPFLL